MFDFSDALFANDRKLAEHLDGVAARIDRLTERVIAMEELAKRLLWRCPDCGEDLAYHRVEDVTHCWENPDCDYKIKGKPKGAE